MYKIKKFEISEYTEIDGREVHAKDAGHGVALLPLKTRSIFYKFLKIRNRFSTKYSKYKYRNNHEVVLAEVALVRSFEELLELGVAGLTRQFCVPVQAGWGAAHGAQGC